jgi:tryptophanyl-tRNA synthetase
LTTNLELETKTAELKEQRAGREIKTKPVVFSGIQPSGYLTIGNYLGAIRNWVRWQDRFDNIFSIVDLHAITVPQDPQELRRNTRVLAGLLLAAGIDPQRSTIFVQSDVEAHPILAWILNTVTPVGWLNRMTQYKSKSAKQKEQTSAGLFNYPVLMAADILLYHTCYVPVGEDQKQHVELTRDIAERFNSMFGETFTLPEPLIPEVGARIMSLTDPTRKMSKSEPEGALGLLDPPDTIRRKIMRATTDSLRDVVFDPTRPGLYNLLTMYELLSGQSPEEIEQSFADKGYGDLKRALAEIVIEELRPLQERYREIEAAPDYIEEVLRAGAEHVRPVANQTVRLVKERVGLGL